MSSALYFERCEPQPPDGYALADPDDYVACDWLEDSIMLAGDESEEPLQLEPPYRPGDTLKFRNARAIVHEVRKPCLVSGDGGERVWVWPVDLKDHSATVTGTFRSILASPYTAGMILIVSGVLSQEDNVGLRLLACLGSAYGFLRVRLLGLSPAWRPQSAKIQSVLLRSVQPKGSGQEQVGHVESQPTPTAEASTTARAASAGG